MKISSMIQLLAVFVLAAVLFAACASDEQQAEHAEEEVPINTLTQAEIDEGWVLLFDGETTTGWRGYNQDSFPEGGWVVEDGTLRVIGTGMGEAGGEGGDIIFDEKFHNFRLSLEWKVSEGGNSGIFYLGQEIENTPIWQSAPEMQILDNDRHPDAELGIDGNRKAGALYDLIPAVPQNFRGAGEWNKAEVLVYRGTVVHFQNGVPVVEYHLGTPAWNDMVANSKFAEYENFGINQPGYIALQDHGDDVWFRNIKIRLMD
ncbi:MAG: DUF1080 domain-containing protein [Balneolaceae bacterium]|nr:MAG: DUF1080 domain-containing protein [Balneolaceae bacterium]